SHGARKSRLTRTSSARAGASPGATSRVTLTRPCSQAEKHASTPQACWAYSAHRRRGRPHACRALNMLVTGGGNGGAGSDQFVADIALAHAGHRGCLPAARPDYVRGPCLVRASFPV